MDAPVISTTSDIIVPILEDGTSQTFESTSNLLATSNASDITQQSVIAPTTEVKDSVTNRLQRTTSLALLSKVSSLGVTVQQDSISTETKKPLQLLDLPIDILREIIGQLPHTNDLTSLALCHSVLHSLCIPCIYSRFDIVWPDVNVDTSSRAGVDALTYGLSTLVMAEEVFREAPWQRRMRQEHATMHGVTLAADPYPVPQRRRGNNYAQYTKKFSLGNGPSEWVQEYLITKEGGKMLGTLVALAIARMQNLETFVWDMPTGVLRDIWLALSSLPDRDDGQGCRLEKIWIRWHNNLEMDLGQGTGMMPPPPLPPQIHGTLPLPPPPMPPAFVPGMTSAPLIMPAFVPFQSSMNTPTETPNFSILPPLRSINVVDIDELEYLDELSILIARSQRRLKELRIGVARHVHQRGADWLRDWEGEDIRQVNYNTPWARSAGIGPRRLGGVLGILTGRVYNLQHNARLLKHKALANAAYVSLDQKSKAVDMLGPSHSRSGSLQHPVTETDEAASSLPLSEADTAASSLILPRLTESTSLAQTSAIDSTKYGPCLSNKLQIETLELERVPLSMAVLTQAIDWSKLTSITLLDCQNHETLWRLLRRQYSPTLLKNRSTTRRSSIGRSAYGLNLKKIHTDTVSTALMTLLKETLAPNSLEVLFLQESRSYNSGVSVEAIYKGPLQRHRGSLKKLLIDSSGGDSDFVDTAARWKRWLLTDEVVWYILSGKMTALRELGITIEYRDWHYLLQHLPNVPHLRSLYLPAIADHPHGSNINPKDLVMQIVDIIALKPEMELCYIGMMAKCFEILESRPWQAVSIAASEVPIDPDMLPSPIDTGLQAQLVATTLAPPTVPTLQPPTPLLWYADHDSESEGNLEEHQDGQEEEDGDDNLLPPLTTGLTDPSHLYTLLGTQPPPAVPTTLTTAPPLYMPPPPPPFVHGHAPLQSHAMSDDEDDGGFENYDADLLDDDDDDLDTAIHNDDEDDPEASRKEWEATAGPRFTLREILFYDDKVAVFKARHGKL